MRDKVKFVLLLVFSLSLAACSPKIYGTVGLFDASMKPVTDEGPEGTVINMINTTVGFEEASHSVSADKDGNFESKEDAIVKGTYKVEARRMGFETETQTVEVGGASKAKVEFKLKKILEGKRRSLEGADSDEDKIINPGEVNIQPPSM
jgi:hypothetical protein